MHAGGLWVKLWVGLSALIALQAREKIWWALADDFRTFLLGGLPELLSGSSWCNEGFATMTGTMPQNEAYPFGPIGFPPKPLRSERPC
jgi:hypothetical protein